MGIGVEWLVDAHGCRADLLQDVGILRQVCGQIIADLDLRVVGEGAWHKFPPPGGVTGLFLLTESHLACHTYPESGLATFNLYCCRPCAGWPWEGRLRASLGAERVVVRSAVRGVTGPFDRTAVAERQEGPG